MNYFLQYIRIEFKRAVRALMSGVVTLIIISLITAGSAAALYTLLQSLGISEPVKIALCAPDESVPGIAVKFLEGIDSIRAVCEFEMTDEESARKGIYDGAYSAAVILPDDFYNAVNTGINPPAKILIPSAPGSDIKSFGELLETAVSFTDTVEAGIYAVTDGFLEYGMIVSRTDMENYLTQIAFDTLLSRTRFFGESFEASFDVSGLITYFSVCGCMLVVMVLCTGFGYMYSSKSRSVSDLMRRNGLSEIVTGFVKFAIMFLQTVFITLICALALKAASEIFYSSGKDMLVLAASDLTESCRILTDLGAVIPVLFSICAFTHLIYSILNGREDSGLILLIIFMIMLIVGGCIVPSIFLPEKIASAGAHLPASIWREDVFSRNAVRELLMGIVFLLGGEAASWLYQRSDLS